MIKLDKIDILSNMTEEDIYESFDEFNEVEFEDLYPEDLYFWLERVFLLSVTCFGLIGNIALIMIFTIHRNKIRTFHRYVKKRKITFYSTASSR